MRKIVFTIFISFYWLFYADAQTVVEWVSGSSLTEFNGILQKKGSNNLNATANSKNILPSKKDGYVEFEIIQQGKKTTFGVSQTKRDVTLENIDYAVELNSNNKIKLYNKGKSLGSFGNYKTGDKIKIERKGLALEIYNEKVLLKKIELLNNNHPLVIHLTFPSQESSIKNPKTNFPIPLSINPDIKDENVLTGELGQIKLNAFGGIPPYSYIYNSPYIEASEEQSSSSSNLGSTPKLTEDVLSNLSSGTYSFSITDAEKNSITRAITVYNKINWIDSIGISVTDSSIRKTTGLDSWDDAGAFSLQNLKENETGLLIQNIYALNQSFAIGLHDIAKTKSGYNFKQMEFSCVVNNRKLFIYKKDKLQLILGTNLNIGDEIKIEKSLKFVRVYYNNSVIYNSVITAPFGVNAQISLHKSSTEIKKIRTTFITPIKINYTTLDINCIAGKMGQINLSPVGGIGPYKFSVNNNIYKSSNINNLQAGTYSIIVKDQTEREANSIITIHNCPVWKDISAYFTISDKGDIIKTGGSDSWDESSAKTNEAFELNDNEAWLSFKVPDTLSVFTIGFSSIEFDETAQSTNYKFYIENSIATIIETDNDGFYNKIQLKHFGASTRFKIKLTKNAIEYYSLDNNKTQYELLYSSKLFSSAKLMIETNIYKSGSKIENVRLSNYGNTKWPTIE